MCGFVRRYIYDFDWHVQLSKKRGIELNDNAKKRLIWRKLILDIFFISEISLDKMGICFSKENLRNIFILSRTFYFCIFGSVHRGPLFSRVSSRDSTNEKYSTLDLLQKAVGERSKLTIESD